MREITLQLTAADRRFLRVLRIDPDTPEPSNGDLVSGLMANEDFLRDVFGQDTTT